MALETYILDSFRVGFSAIKINGSAHTDLIFDSGFMNREDFSADYMGQHSIRNPVITLDPESTSTPARFTYFDTIPAHTGYQSIDQFDGAYSNAILSCNRNYHRRVTDSSDQFLGYETGSISISGSHSQASPPAPANFFLSGDTVADESIAPDATGLEINLYSYGFAGMTFQAGFINCHTEPANANTSVYEGGIIAGLVEIGVQMEIPRDLVAINAKYTPYAQTSVRRIYFENSSTAIVFYRYASTDYKQILVKGTGNIWYGLGDGYIEKALIFDDYAWVYINGNKYLCKSIGGCLNVY